MPRFYPPMKFMEYLGVTHPEEVIGSKGFESHWEDITKRDPEAVDSICTRVDGLFHDDILTRKIRKIGSAMMDLGRSTVSTFGLFSNPEALCIGYDHGRQKQIPLRVVSSNGERRYHPEQLIREQCDEIHYDMTNGRIHAVILLEYRLRQGNDRSP